MAKIFRATNLSLISYWLFSLLSLLLCCVVLLDLVLLVIVQISEQGEKRIVE